MKEEKNKQKYSPNSKQTAHFSFFPERKENIVSNKENKNHTFTQIHIHLVAVSVSFSNPLNGVILQSQRPEIVS